MLNYKYSLPHLPPCPLPPNKVQTVRSGFSSNLGAEVKNSAGVMHDYSFKRRHGAAEGGISEKHQHTTEHF